MSLDKNYFETAVASLSENVSFSWRRNPAGRRAYEQLSQKNFSDLQSAKDFLMLLQVIANSAEQYDRRPLKEQVADFQEFNKALKVVTLYLERYFRSPKLKMGYNQGLMSRVVIDFKSKKKVDDVFTGLQKIRESVIRYGRSKLIHKETDKTSKLIGNVKKDAQPAKNFMLKRLFELNFSNFGCHEPRMAADITSAMLGTDITYRAAEQLLKRFILEQKRK